MTTRHLMAPGDKLLLPSEVRSRVRLSEPTIYRLRRKGKFPSPIVLGERRIAYRASDVENWLADREAANVEIGNSAEGH
jgi:prophage regulatory protein